MPSPFLFLDNGKFVFPHLGGINTIGQRELGIETDLWIFWRQELLNKHLQNEARDFDAIERDRIDVNVAAPTFPVRMRDDDHVVNAAEHREQRVRGMNALANTVEIDAGITSNYGRFSCQFHRLNAVGQFHIIGCYIGIDLLFSENGGLLICVSRAAVFFNEVELSLHGGGIGRSGRVRRAEQNTNNDKNRRELQGFSSACVDGFLIGETRVWSNVPAMV